MFVPDQPLHFMPLLRSYIWGGRRLAHRLGKNLPEDGIWAESWEVVDHREGESIVASGTFEGWSLRQLIETHPHEILGRNNPSERFPLLLKYLDCQRVLSVQVHPDDAYGAKMPQPDLGKTEAWYIVEAEPGAVLYAGLKPGIDQDYLRRAIQQGTTEDCLHTLYPRPGDCIFIAAGTPHALGEGLMVAEIQQASDCTFRIFDWNRVDRDGHPRQLHIEQALEVIDYERGPVEAVTRPTRSADQPTLLVDCDKFQLLEYLGESPLPLPTKRFAIVTIPLGSAEIQTDRGSLDLVQGQSVLIPTACEDAVLKLHPDTTALIAMPPRTDFVERR